VEGKGDEQEDVLAYGKGGWVWPRKALEAWQIVEVGPEPVGDTWELEEELEQCVSII
jgi:hypothetical protein